MCSVRVDLLMKLDLKRYLITRHSSIAIFDEAQLYVYGHRNSSLLYV